jgi:hypothetical protein
MFLVLFMCKCVLPPGVKQIAVDKYININIYISKPEEKWAIYLSQMYIFLYVKYPLFLSNFNGAHISRQIFAKCPNTKFHNVTVLLKLPNYRLQYFAHASVNINLSQGIYRGIEAALLIP